jgi:autotransporter translocation and assembly factor TamB
MQKGVLQLREFLIESAKTRITATGSLDFPRKKLDTAVETKNFDLATMVESVGDLDLIGYADAKGTVQGDFKNPSFLFAAQARETGYKFLRFGEVTGNFKIDNNVLTFEGGAPSGSAAGATIQLRTENIFKKEKRTNLKTQFNNLDVPFLVDNPDLKGKVSGTFELEDTWETSPSGKLSAKIDDFWLIDFHVGSVTAEGQLGNRKFILNPVTFQPPNDELHTIPKAAVFTFDDRGVKFDADFLPGARLTGHFAYETDVFYLDAEMKNLDLRPLLATLELPLMESYADGTVKMAIGLENRPTKIDIRVSRFRLPLEEGELREAEPIEVTVTPPKITFQRVRFQSKKGTLSLGGVYVMDGNSNLTVSGKLDLESLKLLPKYFREGSGLADVDLKLSGNFANPHAVGEIAFDDAEIVLRAFRGRIEGLSGKLKLTGDSLAFDKLRGGMAEGDMVLDGFIGLKGLSPAYYDVKVEAREAALSSPGTYKLIFSGDLALKGPADAPVLSGDIFITDGKYIRNFNITEFILKAEPIGVPEPPNPFMDKLRLDLRIKSPGELAIKNNVAEMFLQSDVRLTGRASQPSVSGALEVLEGSFHYFKIDFQNAKGTIDFRDPSRGPYVDVTASKEFSESFSTVTVFLNIKGYTDNLRLNFTSDAGLEKRDIIALIFTGSLRGSSSFTGTQLAGAVLASQLTSFLQSTLGKSANLDVIRLEAGEAASKNFSTLVVGKRLTDRLSLEFKTDLGVEDPLQGVQAEYLLLDNVLLKAAQLTDGSFNMSFTLRWRRF